MSVFLKRGKKSVFTVHVSTKSASDQTLSSCSQKNINKLFSANTKGFFPSLRTNIDTLKTTCEVLWSVCLR